MVGGFGCGYGYGAFSIGDCEWERTLVKFVENGGNGVLGGGGWVDFENWHVWRGWKIEIGGRL